ncbi:YhhN-like protein-domain-containing protein [Hyaloraphidium curvatum]|nr:YhhN-like protein-domain-containing protein [Hyaloraphidium curvatum]
MSAPAAPPFPAGTRLPLVASLMALYLSTFNEPRLPRLLFPRNPRLGLTPTQFLLLGALVKSLPVALIAADAARRSGPRRGPQRDEHTPSVAAGLAASALGDVFMELTPLDHRFFTAGLSSFLLGHLCYVRGMASLGGPTDWAAAAGVLAFIAGCGSAVWPHVPRAEKLPVAAYNAAIGTMLYKAIASAGRESRGADGSRPEKADGEGRGRSAQWYATAVGAFLFCLSDFTIAVDKFNPAFLSTLNSYLPVFGEPGTTGPKDFIMVTYYLAQLLIGYGACL